MNKARRAGVLLPLFSLPSPYGIGTIGKSAFDFIDFLVASGQGIWQILPITLIGKTGSPYQSLSAFACNPLYIDLDMLAYDGLLTKREVEKFSKDIGGGSRVDYAAQQKFRIPLLLKAASRVGDTAEYREFIDGNQWWLKDLGAMEEGSLLHAGAAEIAKRGRATRDDSLLHPANHVLLYRLQFIFDRQWHALKRYANAHGIGIVGDMPFYTGSESADFISHPELFETDEAGKPSLIAGVPPDAFTDEGQIWNEPVYDWKEHKRTGYAWWLSRFRRTLELFDLCRIDHFRAFAQYFAIPAGLPAKCGTWLDGPGKNFIDAVKSAVPALEVIAEDLGIITDDVRELLAYSGYPGMRVMQFAFDPNENSTYLPHNHIEDCVVYTGTHDNPTLCEWAASAPQSTVDFACAYLGASRIGLPGAMLKAALGSVAATAVIPLQDYMGLGATARINTPGTVSRKNWTWRLSEGDITDELPVEICALTKMYGRC